MNLCRGFLPHHWEPDGLVARDFDDQNEPGWSPAYVRTRFLCRRCGHVAEICLTYSDPPTRWTIYGRRRG